MRCHLEGDALVSSSLERLALVDCDIEIGDWEHEGITRITSKSKRISTPSLRCLQLSSRWGTEQAALFLESKSMPWLTDPIIQRTGDTTIFSQKR